MKLPPLKCEVGGHAGNFSIYKLPIGGSLKWACAPCVIAALGRIPDFLKHIPQPH